MIILKKGKYFLFREYYFTTDNYKTSFNYEDKNIKKDWIAIFIFQLLNPTFWIFFNGVLIADLYISVYEFITKRKW